MLRFGFITDIDPTAGMAKVTFSDDENVSDWLQLVVKGTDNKDVFTININEQVACLMDENSEDGVILGALFNNKTPANGGVGIFKTAYSDGSLISYDRNSGKYEIDIKGVVNLKATKKITVESLTEVEVKSTVKTTIKSTANVTIEAPLITLTGAVAISGALAIGGAVTGASGAPISGNIQVAGKLIAGTDVEVGTIKLKTHTHNSNSGGGITTAPNP